MWVSLLGRAAGPLCARTKPSISPLPLPACAPMRRQSPVWEVLIAVFSELLAGLRDGFPFSIGGVGCQRAALWFEPGGGKGVAFVPAGDLIAITLIAAAASRCGRGKMEGRLPAWGG